MSEIKFIYQNGILIIYHFGIKKSRRLLGVVLIFRLKEIRTKRKISQVRLAMDLNMAQNTISRYERGQREADYETLIMFADYFNVSVDYLLGRTNNPKTNW